MSHCNPAMFKESKFRGSTIQKKVKKKNINLLYGQKYIKHTDEDVNKQ